MVPTLYQEVRINMTRTLKGKNLSHKHISKCLSIIIFIQHSTNEYSAVKQRKNDEISNRTFFFFFKQLTKSSGELLEFTDELNSFPGA